MVDRRIHEEGTLPVLARPSGSFEVVFHMEHRGRQLDSDDFRTFWLDFPPVTKARMFHVEHFVYISGCSTSNIFSLAKVRVPEGRSLFHVERFIQNPGTFLILWKAIGKISATSFCLNGIVRNRAVHQNTSLQSLSDSLYSPNISRFSEI